VEVRQRPTIVARDVNKQLKTIQDQTNQRTPSLKLGASALLFSAVLLIAGILAPHHAHAAQNAIDVIGQSNNAHTTPTFDTEQLFDLETPNSTGLNSPKGMALDTIRHRLFVFDTSNSRIMVYNLDINNDFTNIDADFEIGQPDFTTTGCATPGQARFCAGGGLAYDATNDRLFAAIPTQNRVLVFNLAGGITNGMNASNVLGQTNFTSTAAGTTQSTLRSPQGLLYDSANQKLFVGDNTNHRVMVYNLSGGITDGMNASNVLGQINFTSGTGATTQSRLRNPGGISYDASGSRLFVGDVGNHRVMVYNLAGGITDGMNAANVLGQANFTSGSASISQSRLNLSFGQGFVAYDGTTQRFVVADSNNHRVMIYDLSGGISNGMNASYVLGQPNFTAITFSCATPTTSSSLCAPSGALYGSISQQLFVASHNSRVLVYDMSGSLSNNMAAAIVAGQTDESGARSFNVSEQDNNNPSQYGFSGPQNMVLDQVNHRMFVTDTGAARVLVFNLDSNNQLLDRAADYVLGKPSFSAEYDCTTSASNLCAPSGIAYDPVGDRLFVGDWDDMRVVVFDLSGGITNGMNASYVIGQANLTAAANCTSVPAKGICQPDGIVYDPANQRLFVADASQSRALVYDLSGGIVNDMAPASYLGQTTSTGTGCNAGPKGLCGPEEMAYDPVNNYLFVAGYNDWRVTVYDLSSGVSTGMDASYVIGQDDFNYGHPCVRAANRLCNSTGISYAPGFERLYVSNDDRILVFDLSGGITNGMSAEKILGKDNFTDSYSSCPAGPTQSSLCYIFGIEMDPTSGRLYAVDYGLARATVYDMNLILAPSTLPFGYQGSAYTYTIPTENDAGAHDFTITAGSLPAGLSINSSTGEITGTPTAFGTFNFTLSAVGTNDTPASQSYSIKTFSGTGFYDATDLIGQIDGSDAPIWTQSAADNNGTTNNTGVSYPTSASIDGVRHRLFVADENNNRVLVFDLDANNNLIDHAADYVIGQPDFTSNAAGLSASRLGTGYMGVEYDALHDRLFVADAANNRVLVFSTSTITNGMSATHVLGQPDFTTASSNLTQDGLTYPVGAGYDSKHDRLFVSDDNNRVLVFNVDPLALSNGENADHVIGQPNFTTGSGSTPQNAIGPYYSTPIYDGVNERVFIGDYDNNRIMIFNVDPATMTNGENASFVLGQPDFTTSNYGTSDTLIDGPQALAYDPSQRLLFVEEYGNNRVSVFDVNPATIANGQSVFAVLGQENFVSAVSGTTQQIFGSLDGVGMAYDPTARRLYAPDPGNNRIMIFGFARLQPSAPGGVVGTGYNFTIAAYTQGTPTFSMASGSLPPGLSLNAATGAISGTPSAPGIFNFSILLSDDNGISGTYTHTSSYSVTINPASGGGIPPGGGSSDPPAGTPTPTPSSPVESIVSTIVNIVKNVLVVDLELQPAFNTVEGYVANVSAGETYIFKANDDSQHSVTVKEITDDSVQLSIDNGKTIIVLKRGQTIRQSVTADNTIDISFEHVGPQNGKVRIKFAKVTLPKNAPLSNNGFGAGSSVATADHQKKKFLNLPEDVLVIFPWLLFILLLTTAAVFAWSSLQERRREAVLRRQLDWQKSLAEQKKNFITLSSHYFRTPMTIISGGLELVTSLPTGQVLKEEFLKLSKLMSQAVEELIASARAPVAESIATVSMMQNRKFKIYLIGFLAGSYLTTGIAHFVLIKFDAYSVSYITILEQQAAILLGTVCVLVLWRYRNSKRLLRANAESLVAWQANLDIARNELITDSLSVLAAPLRQTKDMLASVNDPKLTAPAMNGVTELEELVQKFGLVASLSAKSIANIPTQTVILGEIINTITGRLQADIQAKNISIKTKYDAPPINQNATLLSVAIEALISNAVKYSPEGGEIAVTTTEGGNKVELLVTDRGLGITDDKVVQIFQPFSRAEDASIDFNHEGVGLSLYLDKLIMHYLGGSIDFVSHNSGSGTSIRLSVPIANTN